MSDKQTRCPNCATIYKVTVTQLTVAQGMVCCPKCGAEFNALLNLYQAKLDVVSPSSQNQAFDNTPVVMMDYPAEKHVLDIFDRKIESSNINLRTYLNNINSFNHDPIAHFPSLNLSAHQYTSSNRYSKD